MIEQFLRFDDLRRRQIVNNRMTLSRWINVLGFPPGTKLGPNTRVWTESEIAAWLASRPKAASNGEVA
jgi:predicted DNA-binding transcriptional regulator AlpA